MIARTPTSTVLGALALSLIAGGSAACIARLDPAAAAGDDSPTSGDDSSSGSGDDGSGITDGTTPGECGPGGSSRYAPAGAWFLQDVSCTPAASGSSTMIAALRSEGGWGNGNTLQIDFSIDVLDADASTPLRAFAPTDDFFAPDCDATAMPVPASGNVEGEAGYACLADGDCHLIVHQPSTGRLFEMWRANIAGSVFAGGCLAVWDERHRYGLGGRGAQCTSADAAGFPIAPLLFTADEVAAGHIDHAIRFILPNDRTRKGFVAPATHGTNTSGSAAAPAYGVHLRLRADYPIASLPSEGARVVARAMQRYGMFHADGGNIALTAQSDRHTTATWAGLLDAHDLAGLKIDDFEVIDHGAVVPLTNDCRR